MIAAEQGEGARGTKVKILDRLRSPLILAGITLFIAYTALWIHFDGISPRSADLGHTHVVEGHKSLYYTSDSEWLLLQSFRGAAFLLFEGGIIIGVASWILRRLRNRR